MSAARSCTYPAAGVSVTLISLGRTHASTAEGSPCPWGPLRGKCRWDSSAGRGRQNECRGSPSRHAEHAFWLVRQMHVEEPQTGSSEWGGAPPLFPPVSSLQEPWQGWGAVPQRFLPDVRKPSEADTTNGTKAWSVRGGSVWGARAVALGLETSLGRGV